jgi:hypothetical protein
VTGAVLVVVPRTFSIGIGILACTMLGAAAVWIVKFGAPANAIIPAAILVSLVVIGFHGARIDTKSSDESV